MLGYLLRMSNTTRKLVVSVSVLEAAIPRPVLDK